MQNTTPQNDHDMFDVTEAVEISTAEMDAKVTEYHDARTDAEGKKAIYSEANKKADALETELIQMMQACKKSSYKVDGIGTISVYDKFSVKIPASGEDKEKFFQFIEQKYGQEGIDKYRTVSSATLNALYKEITEDEGMTEIPGIGMPTQSTLLSFIRAKGKAKAKGK